MTRIAPAAVVTHRRSGPAAPRPTAARRRRMRRRPARIILGPHQTRVLEVIPNTPPDGQVGVIPGMMVGVAGVAVAQLLSRDAHGSSALPRRLRLVRSGAPRPTSES